MKFRGKTVIVTGAGQGIGRGVALMYATERANVVVAEFDEGKARETANMISDAGGEAYVHVTDVSKPEQIELLMEAAHKKYGTIDILINNAGIVKWISPYELTVEDWDTVMNTNLRSVFLCTREAAKYMRKNGGGTVVNIASTRAIMSEPDTEAYAATKGGIVALTHAMAISLAKDKIKVNAISPGWIETGDYSKLQHKDHDQHPSGRVGKPEDVGRACFYLTGEGNDFINGANLVLDGGMTRKMIYEE